MKVKSLIGLLSAIILAAGMALAQQPAAPAPPPQGPDEPFERNFSMLIDGGGFLGVYAENISRENMARYHMNQVRGAGVTQVVKDSPAEKAGLRKDDVKQIQAGEIRGEAALTLHLRVRRGERDVGERLTSEDVTRRHV